jgi:hypothetical protein
MQEERTAMNKGISIVAEFLTEDFGRVQESNLKARTLLIDKLSYYKQIISILIGVNVGLLIVLAALVVKSGY